MITPTENLYMQQSGYVELRAEILKQLFPLHHDCNFSLFARKAIRGKPQAFLLCDILSGKTPTAFQSLGFNRLPSRLFCSAVPPAGLREGGPSHVLGATSLKSNMFSGSAQLDSRRRGVPQVFRSQTSCTHHPHQDPASRKPLRLSE